MSSRWTPLLPLVLTALVAPGCVASMGGGTSVKSDVDDLRLTVDRLRQQQVETRSLVDGMRGTGDDGPDDLALQVSELRSMLDLLSMQVNAVAERVEGREDELSGVRFDVMRMDRLLEEMRLQVAALAPAEPAPGDTLNPEPSDGSAEQAEPAETRLPETAPVVSATDDPSGIFQRAYADYTRGDYALAAMGFRTILSGSAESPLADDALYYLAAIESAEGRDQEALEAYARLTADYPASDKAPAAYLKRGLMLIDANRIGEGVVQLDYLVKTYPETDEARLARNKLRALGVGF